MSPTQCDINLLASFKQMLKAKYETEGLHGKGGGEGKGIGKGKLQIVCHYSVQKYI